MTEGGAAPAIELGALLRQIDEGHKGLMDRLQTCDPQRFDDGSTGESIKRVLERTADDLNFYYGRLVARAMSLPQAPCLQTADFGSLREAVVSIQVAHRRFSNLLHDLVPSDLDRQAVDEEHWTYTMRQILEMSAGHYALRTQQVERISAGGTEGS